MAEAEDYSGLDEDQESALLRLIYATEGPEPGSSTNGRRFTQDSPVLPEVWFAYAEEPESWQSLLINPFMGRRAGLVARELRDVTVKTREHEEKDPDHPDQPAAVAHIPGLVAASLRFKEMLRVALPSSVWWEVRIEALSRALNLNDPKLLLAHGPNREHDAYRDVVAGWIANLPNDDRSIDRLDMLSSEEQREVREFLALMRLVATILHWMADDRGEEGRRSPEPPPPPKTGRMSARKRREAEAKHRIARREHARAVVDAFTGIYEHWDQQPTRGLIWNIALNRPAELSGNDSTLAIKADAGRRLFDISCGNITWAMIDSGIDVSSPAFCDWERRDLEREEAEQRAATLNDDAEASRTAKMEIEESLYIERPLRLYSNDATRQSMMALDDDDRGWPTRIIERYDFTDIMRLLDISTAKAMHVRLEKVWRVVRRKVKKGATGAPSEQDFWDIVRKASAEEQVGDEVALSQLRTVDAMKMQRMIRRVIESVCIRIGRIERQGFAEQAIAEAGEEAPPGESADAYVERHLAGLKEVALWLLLEQASFIAKEQLKSLIVRLNHGHELDWSILEELLIDMTPDRPGSPHGTQVAGVLGADWRDEETRQRKVEGVCPDIRLIDLRVSDASGQAQEFEAIAALQFILHLNTRSTEKTIHGANISLSIRHDVRNYGCGKTRICEVSEQLVASGVVVVTAAGNGGTIMYETHGGARFQGYQSGSITDPGNAESVITVGATHATKPHQYGVSYFSSRGPTGDGRMKPDLVAPGEKIVTSGLHSSITVVDGTSFAAPHVSGAAALLMARHSELIGQPARIKQVLTSTATNLGRDPNFQGAGMLDTLRALQSL